MDYAPASPRSDGPRVARRANLLALVGMFAAMLDARAGSAPCPPPHESRASLLQLKSSGFAVADAAARQNLALGLIGCLADPNPALRDGIAFEAYFTWLRANLLDDTTRVELLTQLSAMIEPAAADREGFRQPFAALVLAEVARTDRVTPWLSPTQRADLVDHAARYVTSVRDYRGFDSKQGWRHGVAHGSDLLLQLVLNPAVDRAGLDRLLAAVAAQVAPAGEHSYIDGESERLSRPVLYAAQRAIYSAQEWEAWLRDVASPMPLSNWNEAFRSRAGLAKRHNVRAFLFSLYVDARESGDANVQALLPGLQAVLATLR